MLRRKALKNLVLAVSSIAAAGSSVAGWKYSQLIKTPDWRTLQTHQDLLAELTETILPTTTTIGAKAAGVPAFVQHMVQTGLDIKSQNNFINGLHEVSDYCLTNFSRSFLHITPDERARTLTHFENNAQSVNTLAAKVRNRLVGRPFFSILRDLTIIGYCTSEPGATRSLAYEYSPGAFNGCLPYRKGQRSWATS